MKSRKIKVDIGNALPMHGIPLGPVIAAWQAADDLFKNYDYLDSSVRLNVSDTLDVLELMSQSSQETIDRRLNARASRGLSPFGSELTITVRGAADLLGGVDQLILRFLENLYMGMNLAVPGSCNLYRTSFMSTGDLKKISWRRRREAIRIDLSSQPFETAVQFALERGWPTHQEIDLGLVWDWLRRRGLLELDVAESPWQRAVFTMLRISRLKSQYPDVIFYCVQAIEALLGQGAPAGVTKRRVETVLGVPRTHKNWFSDLQGIRSQVAHGTAPLVRLSGFLDKETDNIDLSVAVLLALLQKLVAKDATDFVVNETIDIC